MDDFRHGLPFHYINHKSSQKVSKKKTAALDSLSDTNQSQDIVGPYDPKTDILVHVIDQGRGIARDFACNKDKVMCKMRYFQSYFVGKSQIDELDISVHCDVFIFEWLVRFLKDEGSPKLEIKNVVQILISSEFLGIDNLVENCLVFVAKHLEEVIKLPIEMSCLNVALLERLSTKISLS